MLEKRFNNAKLGFEITSYIDDKQNIWFQGKDVAKILGYSDTDQAIRKHVDEEDKNKAGQVRWCTFINESYIFYKFILKIRNR